MGIRDIFFRLVEVGAPSGYEEPMMRHMLSELEPLVNEVHLTPRGNVVGVQRGTDNDAPSVAFTAHMDQVGLVVSNISDMGFIRFRLLGRTVTNALQGQPVRFITSEGPVRGIVGVKPGHITTRAEAMVVPSVEEMYIDMGARSREEVNSMGIHVGTPIVSDARILELADGLIAGPAVDDKVGLTALIAVAEALKEKRPPSTVYYVGTVEEEIDLKGAFVALYDVEVDMAVGVDTAPAGWQPDVEMRDMVYEIGRGPIINLGEQGAGRIATVHHTAVREWLKKAAEVEGIPYQEYYQFGLTDAGAMAQTRGGIPTAAVSIPRLYAHSPVEAFRMSDLEYLVDLLVKAVTMLEPGFSVNRV